MKKKVAYIDDKTKREEAFNKRKKSLMKRSYEISKVAGVQCLTVVPSETGHVYSFATPKLQPLLTHPVIKAVIKELLASTSDNPTFPDHILRAAYSSPISPSTPQTTNTTNNSTAQGNEKKKNNKYNLIFNLLFL